MRRDVSDQMDLVAALFKDAQSHIAVEPVDVVRDLATLRNRVEHEGSSFLQITLPDFGGDFDSALQFGQIGTSHFRSFKKCKGIPAFLQGILCQVFDRQTGKILDKPDTQAISAIRQICFTFKKVKEPTTPEREAAALETFVKDELIFDEPLDPTDVNLFKEVSDVLWVNVLGREIDLNTLTPGHGPGAVAEQLKHNAKYSFKRWHERLEPYFPAYPNLVGTSNPDVGSQRLEEVTFVEEADEQPVRVITVPKTSKKPRIIAIEPACMQFTQQALKRWLYATLESSVMTAGHINFTDQRINRYLAMESSVTGWFATLDLSSASDRVPRDLALSMFDCNPDLRDAIDACRSRRAQIGEDGVQIHLKKFASMGSALCFPVEAMYFYTICIAALIRHYRLPVTYCSVYDMSRKVYVYGDDIVVPTDAAAAVSETLHKYYCKVNTSKSYLRGKFRESCGMDAFDGADVTPVYVRTKAPRNRRNAKELISWTETSNLLFKRGYWAASTYMKNKVEGILGKLPCVHGEIGGLHWYSFCGTPNYKHAKEVCRWNDDIHVDEVYTWRAASCRDATDGIDGVPRLLKSLLRLETGEPEDRVIHNKVKLDANGNPVQPYEYVDAVSSVRRNVVKLKRCWTPLVQYARG